MESHHRPKVHPGTNRIRDQSIYPIYLRPEVRLQEIEKGAVNA
jgi:hypothetical protein